MPRIDANWDKRNPQSLYLSEPSKNTTRLQQHHEEQMFRKFRINNTLPRSLARDYEMPEKDVVRAINRRITMRLKGIL